MVCQCLRLSVCPLTIPAKDLLVLCLCLLQLLPPLCYGWSSTTSSSSRTILFSNQSFEPISLKEPANKYGRMAFWDESYRHALHQPSDSSEANIFSWYCDWGDLQPFFREFVQEKESLILIPGVGNDGTLRDMFDYGFKRLTAFDYAPEGVECAKQILGHRMPSIDDLRVADCRNLPYDKSSFNVVFDKGTLDSIFLSGGSDKDLSQKHLEMAVSELGRTLKSGGIVFSVNAACTSSIQKSFDNSAMWEQLQDGSLFMTEDGYTSNNIDATILVWRKT